MLRFAKGFLKSRVKCFRIAYGLAFGLSKVRFRGFVPFHFQGLGLLQVEAFGYVQVNFVQASS